MSVRVIHFDKIAGLRNGSGDHWQLVFECNVSFHEAYKELSKFANKSFTAGERMYVSTTSIQHHSGCCRFTVRIYKDADAMMTKLVYG